MEWWDIKNRIVLWVFLVSILKLMNEREGSWIESMKLEMSLWKNKMLRKYQRFTKNIC